MHFQTTNTGASFSHNADEDAWGKRKCSRKLELREFSYASYDAIYTSQF